MSALSDSDQSQTDRRRLLRGGGLLLAMGGGLLPALLPDSAAACHEKPASKGGCAPSGGSKPGSGTGSAPSSSSGGREWQGTITAGDVGRDPYAFFGTSNSAWGVIKRFTPKNYSKPRLSVGRAPDGRPSIQVNIPKGINLNNTFETAPFGSRGLDAARLTLEIWLEKGFNWGSSEGKLGFGLWGGPEDGDHSGGVSISKQRGFSVRNVRGSEKKGGGIALYSYHLNRNSGQWGQVSSGRSRGLPEGRWFKVELEVRLNSGNSSNGSSKLVVDGRQVTYWKNLKFRRDNNVGIRGLMFSDMWGGSEEKKVNWSPKAQKMWYSNYKIVAI